MPHYGPGQAKLVDGETGEEIPPGSRVADFRGDETVFCYISRLPEPGKSGKVVLSDTPENPLSGRECYPGVVGARIEIVQN